MCFPSLFFFTFTTDFGSSLLTLTFTSRPLSSLSSLLHAILDLLPLFS